MHPLLDPFDGSRQDAVEMIRRHVAALHPLASSVARLWPGRQGEDLLVTFAWFQTGRDLMRVPDAFVQRRGLELLTEVLDAPERGRDDSVGVLTLAVPPRLEEYEISPLSCRPFVDEARRGIAVGAFASQRELHEHASQLTHPEVACYLRILGQTDDRSLLEGQALGEGVQLIRWLADLSTEFRSGRLRVASEDVARFGVELASLERGSDTPAGRRLLAASAEWAGGFLRKGWPLCDTLGWARGRVLAGFLRWQVAELAALEERSFAPGDPPPAGWMRALACTVAALATRAPARW